MSPSETKTRKRKRKSAPPAEAAEPNEQPAAAAAEAEPEPAESDAPAALEAQPSEAEPGEPASDEDPVEDVDPEVARQHAKRSLESLIFVADRPVAAVQLGRIIKMRVAEVRELLKELMAEYEGRGIELVELGGGYVFRSSPASAGYVRDFVAQRPVRLTRAQLETLALVAYRQPITRPEIDDVRGVDTGSAVRVLLERGLIRILGRKDEPGRPLLYGTAPAFLEFFGLRTLKDLPTLREFADLTDESRELFKAKTGESVEEAQESLDAQEEEVDEDIDPAALAAELADEDDDDLDEDDDGEADSSDDLEGAGADAESGEERLTAADGAGGSAEPLS